MLEGTLGVPEKISSILTIRKRRIGAIVDFKCTSPFLLFIALPINQPINMAKRIIGKAMITQMIPSALVTTRNKEKMNKLEIVPIIASFKSGSKPEEIPTANGRKKKKAMPRSAQPNKVSPNPRLVNESPSMKLMLNDLSFNFIYYSYSQ